MGLYDAILSRKGCGWSTRTKEGESKRAREGEKERGGEQEEGDFGLRLVVRPHRHTTTATRNHHPLLSAI